MVAGHHGELAAGECVPQRLGVVVLADRRCDLGELAVRRDRVGVEHQILGAGLGGDRAPECAGAADRVERGSRGDVGDVDARLSLLRERRNGRDRGGLDSNT